MYYAYKIEFLFRCVYCLSRERWNPEGQDAFSVDHERPQSTHPEQTGDYDNLVYHVVTRGDGRCALFPDDGHYQRLSQGLADEAPL